MQSHLESLDESEGCDRDGFEEAFYVLSDRIRELISPSPTLRTSIFSPSSSSVRDSDSSTHIRMPKLNYRHFPANMMNGSRLSIHLIRLSIPHLALKYAKISVSTSVTHRHASAVISSLELSDANYDVTWSILSDMTTSA